MAKKKTKSKEWTKYDKNQAIAGLGTGAILGFATRIFPEANEEIPYLNEILPDGYKTYCTGGCLVSGGVLSLIGLVASKSKISKFVIFSGIGLLLHPCVFANRGVVKKLSTNDRIKINFIVLIKP